MLLNFDNLGFDLESFFIRKARSLEILAFEVPWSIEPLSVFDAHLLR